MQPLRYFKALFVGCLLVLALGGLDAKASPFTNSAVYTWEDNDNSDLDYVLVDRGATFAEFSSTTQTARARADYGVNGAYALADGAGPNGIDGQSTWSDGFVVAGGSGTLSLSLRLTGTTTGVDQGFMYGLYVSQTPFENLETYNGLDVNESLFGVAPLLWVRHDDVEGTIDPGTFDETFLFDVPYVSGETFYITSVLDVGAWQTASADFWGSASFGISAPAGAVLSAMSGTQYAAAMMVPEPGTYALMLAGLALLGFTRTRRSRAA